MNTCKQCNGAIISNYERDLYVVFSACLEWTEQEYLEAKNAHDERLKSLYPNGFCMCQYKAEILEANTRCYGNAMRMVNAVKHDSTGDIIDRQWCGGYGMEKVHVHKDRLMIQVELQLLCCYGDTTPNEGLKNDFIAWAKENFNEAVKITAWDLPVSQDEPYIHTSFLIRL